MARPRSTAGSSSAPASGSPRRSPSSQRGSTELPKTVTVKASTRKRPAAKPLTAREMVNKAVKLASQRWQPRSSISLKTGPRGQVMPEVTIHVGDESGVGTIAEATLKAVEIFDALRQKYAVDGDRAGNGGE